MKKLVVFIFSLQVLSGISQNVDISGTAIGYPNELVRVIVYADQFSRLDATLATTRTDVWGNFSITVFTKEPTYAFLALGLKRGDFYLDPGSSYQFQILKDTLKGSVFDQLPLQFNLIEEKDSLNQMIGMFNYKYNVFLYEKQRTIMRSKDKGVIREFVNEMRSEFISGSQKNDNYLENYINYTLASLEWISKSRSDSAIIVDYFLNKELLRENIAYTDFFRDFFKEYMNIQKVYQYDELVSAVRSQQLSDVDSLLMRDKLLAQDLKIRELVLISLLARNFYNQDIGKEKILHLLSQFQTFGAYEESKEVAKNYIKKLMQLQNGTKAPAIDLYTTNGKMLRLDDLKGQFILLDFISSTCNPCIYDFEKLRQIQQTISSKFEIIVIVTDNDLNKSFEYILENEYNWTILNLNNDILLLENYQVKTFPAYIFINPDGTIAMAPAPPPDDNLETFIERFIARYKNGR